MAKDYKLLSSAIRISYRLPVAAILILFLSAPFACIDLEFDEPPEGGDDPGLPVNITIADLKARHIQGQYEEITDDVTFSGLVISDDEAGNFFKQLVVADETGGIEIRIEISDLHNIYPVGRKVYVKAKGLWLGDYNGLIQLGAAVDIVEDELIRIPETLADKFIIVATYGNPVDPKPKTIDQLLLSDVSTLIKLESIQFITADAGETWAEPTLQLSLNREIEDCLKRRLIVRTSGFASFAADPTPEGNGSIVGVLGIYGGDYQLVIRDQDDVMMSSERCASVSHSASSIRNLFSGGTTTITSGTLSGIVISDRTSQSVDRLNLFLQDETGGIVVRFTDDHSFSLGDEIQIDVAGAGLSEFHGLLQISGLDPGAVTIEGHPGDVNPRDANVIDVLTNAQIWESTLVRIENVTLSGNNVYNGNVVVTDSSGSMLLFTRSLATFANDALPSGLVTITAIVSEYDAPQLVIRNISDVSGGSTGGGELDESFDAIGNDMDVILPGWVNIAVKGDRIWRGKVFSGNHYAQATAFGDTQQEMETWLITPVISLDEPKKFSFESAQAFWTHDGLSVWVSSDFDGTNFVASTWQQLNPILAKSTDTEHAFIPSGDIDLSSFTGAVRIGFRYTGSGPGGQTSSFRIDNVKAEKL